MSALSDPDGAIVRLAKTFVVRHLRPTEYGVEDVEAHWRELPLQTRQAFLKGMHAPARPELQSLDRPETRPLRDLPPGLRAVHEAVERRVGQRKLESLQEKVGDDTRSAGYLHGGGLLPTIPSGSRDVRIRRGELVLREGEFEEREPEFEVSLHVDGLPRNESPFVRKRVRATDASTAAVDAQLRTSEEFGGRRVTILNAVEAESQMGYDEG